MKKLLSILLVSTPALALAPGCPSLIGNWDCQWMGANSAITETGPGTYQIDINQQTQNGPAGPVEVYYLRTNPGNSNGVLFADGQWHDKNGAQFRVFCEANMLKYAFQGPGSNGQYIYQRMSGTIYRMYVQQTVNNRPEQHMMECHLTK